MFPRAGVIAFAASMAVAQHWEPQTSGTTASFRGLCAVNKNVVWASGTGGTYVATRDGGAHWKAAVVPGAESLDFRDVQVFDNGRTAYLLSIGPGDKSRIYKTTDAGDHWEVQLKNPDADGFFDEMAFWSPVHGALVGDPVGKQFVLMTTTNAGATWTRRTLPPALEGEGAFAASGTGIVVRGKNDVWFGTGGKGGARVFHSTDGGANWTITPTPIRNDAASAGIFSVAFSDTRHAMVAGGDYAKPAEAIGNIALTSDGGATWSAPTGNRPAGFRSAVAYVPALKAWIATGTSGSDISSDGGQNWRQFDTGDYNAISFLPSGEGWAAGPHGRIARYSSRRASIGSTRAARTAGTTHAATATVNKTTALKP